MPEISIEFDLNCTDCGRALKASAPERDRTRTYIEVEPCEFCLQEKYQEGYRQGVNDAEG